MEEIQPKPPASRKSRIRRILRYSIAVAASILLIFICIEGYNFYRLSPDRLYAAQYSSYDLSTHRDTVLADLSPIEKAYKEKDFAKVIQLRKNQAKFLAKEEFLVGLASLEMDDPDSAINSFTTVIMQDDTSGRTVYKDEAEYYLAIAYLKNRDYDQALELMNTIYNNPDHLYHEKFSNRFIRKVKMLKWR